MKSILLKTAILFGLSMSLNRSIADMMILEGIDSLTTTTGDLIDGAGPAGITTGVEEIPGLLITARSGGSSQTVNATTTSLGIDTTGSGDDTDAFDVGEVLILSFSQDVRINLLDFNLFDDPSESFTVSVGSLETYDIAYDDLSNKTSGWFTTNWVVSAGTNITFSTSGPNPIGLDGIDLNVIPEPAVLGLISLAGVGTLVGRRFRK